MPLSPGVYWFTDAAGSILYVGKAKNLKNRIKSYLRIQPSDQKTYQLVTTASAVQFKPLSSEFHALLSEAELIKTHQPPYNLISKDDKSPLYLIVTKEEYPRLLPIRHKTLTISYSHLPASHVFGPFASSLDAKRILRLSRRIFKFCSLSPHQRLQHKSCFYTHLGLCSGSCTGRISHSDYLLSIRHLRLFLKGQDKRLLKSLKTQMLHASDLKEFEHAALLRDQIESITRLYSSPSFNSLDLNLPTLLSDQGANKISSLRRQLHRVGYLSSTHPLDRIEAYDISNTSGSLSTASMVVFLHGHPSPHQYRHFRIKYTKGPNDPAMIKEALIRRFSHSEWPEPNLIIIDGGVTQLKAALQITQNHIPTISLAKNPDRLLIPSPASANVSTLKLIPGTPSSNLVVHLRDEAHRFAKKYHLLLRLRHQTLSP